MQILKKCNKSAIFFDGAAPIDRAPCRPLFLNAQLHAGDFRVIEQSLAGKREERCGFLLLQGVNVLHVNKKTFTN